MADKIFWEYLEALPEQEAAWYEWYQSLAGWYCFNTFYTHYLKIEDRRTKFLECAMPCEHNCPRQVVGNSPSDITAVCTQEKADSIQLKFRDILIYSLRREVFHQALCLSLQIKRPSGNIWSEFGNTWYLGDYYDAVSKIYYPVYLTYLAATLTEAINSLCRLHNEPFVLMTPTMRGMTLKAQQLLVKSNSFLLSMANELTLQPDGSFKSVRNISKCMKSYNHLCPQAGQSTMLPIEAYKYLFYKDK